MSPSLLCAVRALGAVALTAACIGCGGGQTGVSDAKTDGCRREPAARTGCLEVAPNSTAADDGTPSTLRSTSKDRIESVREEARMHAAPRPEPTPRSAPPPRGGGGGMGGFHPPPRHVGAY